MKKAPKTWGPLSALRPWVINGALARMTPLGFKQALAVKKYITIGWLCQIAGVV